MKPTMGEMMSGSGDNLLSQAIGELRGFQRHLARSPATITAAQLAMVLDVAAKYERLRKAAEAFRLKIEQVAVPIALARQQGVRWDAEEMELKAAME